MPTVYQALILAKGIQKDRQTWSSSVRVQRKRKATVKVQLMKLRVVRAGVEVSASREGPRDAVSAQVHSEEDA